MGLITRTATRGAIMLALIASAALIAACGGASSHAASGNATDRAFVRQMIPHHRMAVEMAGIATHRGQRAQIRRPAANIITAQDTEIRR